MTKSKTIEWWRLMRGAAYLGVPYHTALRFVLTGELHGEQRDGKWWVDSESVQQMEKQRAKETLVGSGAA